MLPVNVRNTKLKLVLVPVMTIILSATLLNGVPITVITPRPVRCRLLLMINARTESLITKAVKRTGRGPVVKPDMLTLVLPDGYMPLQTDALMTNHSVNAVALHLQLDVRPIIP